jgi:hypothetical protein
MVPRTEAAVRRMDRAFDAYREGVVRTSRGFGGVQIMGCVQDGGCTIEGITVTAPPQERDAQLTCGPEDVNCNGGANPGYSWDFSGGEYAGGGDYGGWVTDGDTDNDGDHLDEGPIAFTICVVGALGPNGWGALGMTALASYEFWGARTDVQNAYEDYQDYQLSPNWNYETDQLYRRLWDNAKSTENQIWRGMVASGGWTLYELAKAVRICIPAGAAPV